MILGIIADGNRRWAKKNNLPAKEGHIKGFEAISNEVFESCFQNTSCTGLVIYGFSTENWKRDPFEIKNLMDIYAAMCDEWKSLFKDKPARLKWCGNRDRVPRFLRKKIEAVEEKTKDQNSFTIYLCLDYGGQDEIKRAIKKGGEDFESFLEVPEIDLIIRTGGEQRISNFCIWQAAYSEFFFLEKFLPELKKEDVDEVIKKFMERDRRKGGN